MCDSLILEKVKSKFFLEDEQIVRFKELVLARLNASKKKQATWYVKTKINNMIKNDFFKEEDITKLEIELDKICKKESIEKIYSDRIEEIDNIIEKNDYEKAIKIIDNKQELLELAGKVLENNYKGKILTLIMQDTELQINIKNKYFNDMKISKCESNE